jgi:Flp pilus assembly protein CpaB
MVAMAPAAEPLTPGRALRRPRRIDLRAGLGVALLVAATAGNIGFYVLTSDSRSVLVAVRDLPAGGQLTAADLSVARMRMDDAVYAAAVPADDRSQVLGRQLTAPVYAHQVLARGQLSGRAALAPGQLALTIPVSAETAAGGRIRRGDEVQVLVTTAKGRPESRTAVVLPRVAVHDVAHDERFAVVNTSAAAGDGGAPARGAPTSLTLSVTQEEALELARARWNGELDVALLPPAAPSTPAAAAQGAQSLQTGQTGQPAPAEGGR